MRAHSEDGPTGVPPVESDTMVEIDMSAPSIGSLATIQNRKGSCYPALC